MTKRNVTEVRKALTAIRKQVTICGQSDTYSALRNNAEMLQHMAFDLKDIAANGGTWAERQEDEL